MEVYFSQKIFFVLMVALAGGLVARVFKFQPIVGYILGGVIFGSFFRLGSEITKLAEIGAILLLFSVGIELSFQRLSRVAKIAVFGGISQILLATGLGFGFLSLLGFDLATSLILAAGFSLSSTALVVKILADRGELDTLSGEIMTGWLLVQDLAVVPIIIVLSLVGKGFEGSIFIPIFLSLLKAGVVVLIVYLLGKLITPYFIHKVASTNSRELLVIVSIALALGTAAATSFLGISAALGAFLAGVVISESQESHAVFAETRPLRDLFVALFFVTLGFLVNPSVIFANLLLIFGLVLFILIIKTIIVFSLTIALGYHGKVALHNALGLSQIGEFSFVIFSLAGSLGVISAQTMSIGIATALLSLLFTPFLFKLATPLWRRVRIFSNQRRLLGKLLLGRDEIVKKEELTGHTIICGYGRVGSWVGRALDSLNIPFIVVDYNHEIISDLHEKGVAAIYGDPTEPEVITAAGALGAKAVVLAIPDILAQEEIITYLQKVNPSAKIISRVHKDKDWDRVKLLKVDKLIQPEFEASISIIRTILLSMGKSKEEIVGKIRKIRLSHAKI